MMDRRTMLKSTVAVVAAASLPATATAAQAYTAHQFIADMQAAGVCIHWRHKPKGALMYQVTGVDWPAWDAARIKAHDAGIDDMDVWDAMRDALS